MDLEKIGKFIAKLRKEQNMTQEELAEKIGVNAKTISKWETGLNLPDSILLFSLSKELKVNVQDLLSGEIIKKDKINKSFVNIINSYISNIKRKFLILISLIIIILITIFCIIFTLFNYNKNNIYDINFSSDLYQISGYAIFNPQKVLVIIPDIIYIGGDETLIKEYSISIENNKKKIYYMTENDISDDMKLLSDILNETKINFNNENDTQLFSKEDLNNLYLIFTYTDNKNNKKTEKLKLNIYEEYTNNKLIY